MKPICIVPNYIPEINLDECVGLSLGTINLNFKRVQTAVCENYNDTNNIIDGVNTLNIDLSALYDELPRFSKAFVTFNGTVSSQDGLSFLMYNSYNVADVKKFSTGVYALSFVKPFNDNNYALVATCRETLSGGTYVWAQPTVYASNSAVININNKDGVFYDAEYITVSVYSL